MTTCANCKTPSIYQYLTIPYCEKHLPRFLRDRHGKAVSSVKKSVPVSVSTKVDPGLVPDFSEAGKTTVIIEEPVVEAPVEEVVEPVIEESAPKKKATPKAE